MSATYTTCCSRRLRAQSNVTASTRHCYALKPVTSSSAPSRTFMMSSIRRPRSTVDTAMGSIEMPSLRSSGSFSVEALGGSPEPSYSDFDPLVYDEDHVCVGIGLILEYLNFGNSEDELESIKLRSGLWCREYYGVDSFHCCSPQPILDAHPCIFSLGVPSWKRLSRGPHVSDPGLDSLKGSRKYNLTGTVSFPEYSEPTLLEDAYRLLCRYQEEHENHLPSSDEYGHLRMPLDASCLWNSPIIFHVPEMVCHLAHIPSEDINDEDPLGLLNTNTSCVDASLDCVDTILASMEIRDRQEHGLDSPEMIHDMSTESTPDGSLPGPSGAFHVMSIEGSQEKGPPRARESKRELSCHIC